MRMIELRNLARERKLRGYSKLRKAELIALTCVKHLYGLVDELNDMETEMVGMKPKDAIVLDQVPLVA